MRRAALAFFRGRGAKGLDPLVLYFEKQRRVAALQQELGLGPGQLQTMPYAAVERLIEISDAHREAASNA